MEGSSSGSDGPGQGCLSEPHPPVLTLQRDLQSPAPLTSQIPSWGLTQQLKGVSRT